MAKSKMTDDLIRNYCNAVSLGLTTRASCDYAGISQQAYYSYVKKAEEDIAKGKKTKYVEFYDAVKKAEASFRVFHMSKIRDAAESGSWQASAWSLERRFPEEYGKHVQVDADNGILGSLLNALKSDE